MLCSHALCNFICVNWNGPHLLFVGYAVCWLWFYLTPFTHGQHAVSPARTDRATHKRLPSLRCCGATMQSRRTQGNTRMYIFSNVVSLYQTIAHCGWMKWTASFKLPVIGTGTALGTSVTHQFQKRCGDDAVSMWYELLCPVATQRNTTYAINAGFKEAGTWHWFCW
jgi:hypothetical protein